MATECRHLVKDETRAEQGPLKSRTQLPLIEGAGWSWQLLPFNLVSADSPTALDQKALKSRDRIISLDSFTAIVRRALYGRWAHLDVELLHDNWPRLAHAVRAAHGLGLQGGVEGRLHEEDVVGGRQVDADGAAAHAEQEHSRGRVLLEGLYRLRSSPGLPRPLP